LDALQLHAHVDYSVKGNCGAELTFALLQPHTEMETVQERFAFYASGVRAIVLLLHIPIRLPPSTYLCAVVL